MKKTNDSFSNESPDPSRSLTYSSNNRTLSEDEWFVVSLASTTQFCEGEPDRVTKTRQRFQYAEITKNHFQNVGFRPVFDSFDFVGLFMKGIK
jgi:hypothetical protein